MKILFTALLAFSPIIASTASGQLKWDNTFVEVNASPEDVDARLHFPFVNAGKYPVNFTAVVPACGCTTAHLDKTSYAPGQRGEIAATFNVAGRFGVQEKSIQVRADDKSEPEKTLRFRVHILQTVQINPTVLMWDASVEKTTRTINIKVVRDQPLNLVRVDVTPPDWKTSLRTIKPGREYCVDVTPINPVQQAVALLTIVSDSPPDNPQTFRAHLRIK